MIAEPKPVRTQAERRAKTAAALLAAARGLFVAKGFAETGTPEIVQKAGVTRGALYHLFDGKTALFEAVLEAEAEDIGRAIDAATHDIGDPDAAMVAGTRAYFAAMAVPGRAELILVQAPAVLGYAEAARLSRADGGQALRDGLAHALPSADGPELDAMADVLSAAFDRAALAVADAGDPETYLAAMLRLLAGLTANSTSRNDTV